MTSKSVFVALLIVVFANSRSAREAHSQFANESLTRRNFQLSNFVDTVFG